MKIVAALTTLKFVATDILGEPVQTPRRHGYRLVISKSVFKLVEAVLPNDSDSRECYMNIFYRLGYIVGTSAVLFVGQLQAVYIPIFTTCMRDPRDGELIYYNVLSSDQWFSGAV